MQSRVGLRMKHKILYCYTFSFQGTMMGNGIIIFSFLTQFQCVFCHMRWKCPAPRSPEVGIKIGTCGGPGYDNDFTSFGEPIDISPGPLRVVFEEAVAHVGAPVRISLSGNSTDDESCLLLDHIPHNEEADIPDISNPETYVPYVITLEIPDVSCERCSLHLANPMTDKIGDDGSPTGIGCTDPNGSCFSVYHSCTVPLRISGSIPRDEYICPRNDGATGPIDWPIEWIGDNGMSVDASVQGVYRRESSIWSSDTFVLTTVPQRYQEEDGGICEGVVTSSPTSTPLPTLSPATVISPTPTIDEICIDSTLDIARANKGCTFLMDNMNYCSDSRAKSHCPLTCNACPEYQCVDSELQFVYNGNRYDCSDVQQVNEQVRERVCKIEGIQSTCRATCEVCE